jgi:hypothetical protein
MVVYPITYPGLERLNLAVKPAGFFGPQLLQNGVALKKQKGCYTVVNSTGQQVSIKLKGRFMDPVPRVVIGSDTIDLAPALKWYEYTWAGFPIILLAVGGALGGGLGAAAAFSNMNTFRSDRSTAAKFVLTGLTSFAAAGTWFILAMLIMSTRR